MKYFFPLTAKEQVGKQVKSNPKGCPNLVIIQN